MRREAKFLSAFDRQIFGENDYFRPKDFAGMRCFWLIVDGEKIGMTAMCHDSGVWNRSRPFRRGSLYVTNTAVAEKYRGAGFGALLKAWQILYAKRRSCKKIVTNCRASNKAIIALNRKFGFRITGSIGGYYDKPKETSAIMELKF